MKKFIILSIIMLVCVTGFTQSNLIRGKIVTASHVKTSTAYSLSTSDNYAWAMWVSGTYHRLTTDSVRIKVQESFDNSTWNDYPGFRYGYISGAHSSTPTVVSFQDFYSPADYLRLYVTMPATDTIILTVGYTLKSKIK